MSESTCFIAVRTSGPMTFLPRVMSPYSAVLDSEQAGYAAPLEELTAHQVSGALRRHHEHVHVLWRDDLLEVDVEAVPEGEGFSRAQPRLDLSRVHDARHLVGHEHHDDVAPGAGIGRLLD